MQHKGRGDTSVNQHVRTLIPPLGKTSSSSPLTCYSRVTQIWNNDNPWGIKISGISHVMAQATEPEVQICFIPLLSLMEPSLLHKPVHSLASENQSLLQFRFCLLCLLLCSLYSSRIIPKEIIFIKSIWDPGLIQENS